MALKLLKFFSSKLFCSGRRKWKKVSNAAPIFLFGCCRHKMASHVLSRVAAEVQNTFSIHKGWSFNIAVFAALFQVVDNINQPRASTDFFPGGGDNYEK